MDSEKNTHMRELLEAGRPITDEGPYYHHAWWEAYKGSVKGKLGGGLLGAVMGGVAGGIAVLGIAAANMAFPAAPLLIIAGFAAAGIVYGVHEFAEVGKVAAAVSSTQKTAEKRMKVFEEGKFAEIKEEIGELKALVKGEPVPEKKAALESAAIKYKQDHYRTSHFQGSKVNGWEKIIFWKIALVGLAVGVIAGAILAAGGGAAHLLESLGTAQEGLSATSTYIASITACGAVGASFGINRDIFRQIFDQTDMWFRGFLSHAHSRATLLGKEPQHSQTIASPAEEKQTILYDPQPSHPLSDTHFRDQQIARAQKALLDMDHTQMSPH